MSGYDIFQAAYDRGLAEGEARRERLATALRQAIAEIDGSPYQHEGWGWGIAFRIEGWRALTTESALTPEQELESWKFACAGWKERADEAVRERIRLQDLVRRERELRLTAERERDDASEALSVALSAAVDRWHESCPNGERNLQEWLGIPDSGYPDYVMHDVTPAVIAALADAELIPDTNIKGKARRDWSAFTGERSPKSIDHGLAAVLRPPTPEGGEAREHR